MVDLSHPILGSVSACRADGKLVPPPLRQVDQVPPNDTVRRRYRVALDHLRQSLALRVIQQGHAAPRKHVYQPIRTSGVGPQQPIAPLVDQRRPKPLRRPACRPHKVSPGQAANGPGLHRDQTAPLPSSSLPYNLFKAPPPMPSPTSIWLTTIAPNIRALGYPLAIRPHKIWYNHLRRGDVIFARFRRTRDQRNTAPDKRPPAKIACDLAARTPSAR